MLLYSFVPSHPYPFSGRDFSLPPTQKGIPVEDLTAKELAFALNVIGAIIGTFAAVRYAFQVWRRIEKANLATWSVVWVLDFVGLYLTYVTGNEDPYIQIGWCAAATLILIAAWSRRGIWRWTNIESATLAIAVASVAIWIVGTTSKVAIFALVGYLAACFVSVWPQARDYLDRPDVARKSAWMWQVSMLSLVFIIASKWVAGKFGVGDTLIYYALLGLNVIMATLCMRRLAPVPVR